MAGETECDVFLSYSRADETTAISIIELLRDQVLRVVAYDEKSHPGGKLNRQAAGALRRSRKVVILVSKTYLSGSWPKEAFDKIAKKDPGNRDRTLIPLLLDDCDSDGFLPGVHLLDFRNEQDFGLRAMELIQAIGVPAQMQFKDEPSREPEAVLDPQKRGRIAREKGSRFEEEVAATACSDSRSPRTSRLTECRSIWRSRRNAGACSGKRSSSARTLE